MTKLMVKVFTLILTEQDTVEAGMMTSNTVKAPKRGQTEQLSKGNTSLAKKMAKESSYLLMDLYTRAILSLMK